MTISHRASAAAASLPSKDGVHAGVRAATQPQLRLHAAERRRTDVRKRRQRSASSLTQGANVKTRVSLAREEEFLPSVKLQNGYMGLKKKKDH